MKVTPEILQEEFIGLEAKVVESMNPSYKGLVGKVVDETLNTLALLHNNEEKTIVKELSTFHFRLPDGTVVKIEGKAIVGRPEDRVKRRLRRRW